MKKGYETLVLIKMFFEMEEVVSTSVIIDQEIGIEDDGNVT